MSDVVVNSKIPDSPLLRAKTLDDVRVVDEHFYALFANLKKIHESCRQSSSGSIHTVIGAPCSGRTTTR